MSRNKGNRGFTQLQPLVTVERLKQEFLFGIGIKDAEGNEISDQALQSYINNAISILEHDLDLAIMPRCETEQRDYYGNDYYDWGYLQLNHFPVIEIESIRVTYLRDNQGQPETVLDIPREWQRVNKETGIVRMVPNNKFPAQLQVDSGGAFFPELFRRHSHVPELWEIKYTHGFEDGKIPVLVNYAIGYLASIQALSIAGNLILGAGIAGSSLSLDGLSQSIQTTQSAENSGYSATRKEYADLLFGKTKEDPNAIIEILRRYYKGQGIQIL